MRILLSAGLLLATMLTARTIQHRERTVSPSHPLQTFPVRLENWQGRDLNLEARMVDAVGVDDYLYRSYTDPAGNGIDVYVGFYGSQANDKLIHSPKNCLPGTGWQAVRSERVTVPVSADRRIDATEYLVNKDLSQLLVLYWFQARGRTIASEYTLRFWNVVDAVTQNRTDGSLVRLSASTRDGEPQARERLLNFIGYFYSPLERALPQAAAQAGFQARWF